MKFQIQDLVKGRFKKSVVINFPSETLNEDGEMQYDQAHFVGLFVNVTDKERESHHKRLGVLQEKHKKMLEDEDTTFDDKAQVKRDIDDITRSFIQKYFVGFEKHPKHDLPFLNGETELQSTPENIAQLLEIQLIREGVSDVYHDEVNKNQNEKINKYLAGNLKK